MMPAFAETRFETGYIIYGTSGGPVFNTDIVEVNSGSEFRNANWLYAKGRWDYGERKILEPELVAIRNFFRARKGSAQGFRFKDWADYKDETYGILGLTGLATGGPGPFQLVKKYVSGSETDYRLITKPVAGTVTLYDNGALIDPANYTLNTTTGVVTFTVSPVASHVLTWKGEFDVPVRFDTDELKARFDSAEISTPGVVKSGVFYLFTLPIVEVRE